MFFQLLYPGISLVAWPIVVLIGFSRVYVGAHYPSDVLGGWMIGGLGAWFYVRLLRSRHWLR